MSRPDKRIFERLGREGLALVLDDLLDRGRLVKLANACGLKYPGSRTAAQKRERLLADLAARAEDHDAARQAILRALEKETKGPARDWAALTPEEKAGRLGDERYLRAKGNVGRHLYFLAGEEERETGFETLLARQQLLRLGTNGRSGDAADAKPSRNEGRLRKRQAELEKKIAHLEAQLAKSRDAEKAAKRKHTERCGELAESRMLNERLHRELVELRSAGGATGGAKAVEDVTRAVRRLASQQRKLIYRMDNPPEAAATPADGLPDSLAEALKAVKSAQKELAAARREQRKEGEALSARLDGLAADLIARIDAAAKPRPRRGRPAAGSERVGVFIDVQNMHYGARQLKGKLDFDALLRAAVLERRLIRATAYVVESKEIDQSGFIALLQQRAIEVRRKTVRVRADGSMKGDWDMELALEVLEAAPELDVVVLVSGDGDFTSLVQRVKSIGPRVEVIGFPRTTAKSLVQAADRFEPLGRKFMIYPKRKAGSRRGGRAKASGKESSKASAKDGAVAPAPRSASSGASAAKSAAAAKS
jgi:uncharacterized LabA/DUF88 family protein